MAIKRKIKAVPKPVAKPELRPPSKATKVSVPTPSPALTQPQSQLDLVRSPNFDAAIAQKNYDLMLSDMASRAQAGQFDMIRDQANNPNIAKSLADYQANTYPTGTIGQIPQNQNMPSLMPIQTPGSDALNQDLANRGMGGGVPTPIPQNQQMQSYQNFLNQGMSNMASVNQGATKSFANTQPRMQKLMPTPRKFSTASNQPARFA